MFRPLSLVEGDVELFGPLHEGVHAEDEAHGKALFVGVEKTAPKPPLRDGADEKVRRSFAGVKPEALLDGARIEAIDLFDRDGVPRRDEGLPQAAPFRP